MPPEHPTRLPAEDGTAAAFPAPTPIPPEILPGLPQDTAFAVWQVLRCVTLWNAEAEARRAEVFDPAYMQDWERRLLTAPIDPEARFPLAVIVGELAGAASPGARLSWACVCVADWALGKGHPRTALAFAEAAAQAAPEHPRYAWLAGRLMRSHGDPRGGERWLKRALRLAAAQRDWETQARALTALGNLCVETGRYPEAKDFHTRALRISRRWRLREQEGMALHDLFVIATEEGNRTEAERCARGALEAYRDSVTRVSWLAHDVAYWWMDHGWYAQALGVFLALRQHFPRPDDQLRVLGNVGRAAGGCGDPETFAAVCREAENLRPLLETGGTVPTALLELAYGAVSLGNWPVAEALAREASDAARERAEATVLTRAAELLEVIRAGDAVPAATRVRRPGDRAPVDRLAAALVASLGGAAPEAAAHG